MVLEKNKLGFRRLRQAIVLFFLLRVPMLKTGTLDSNIYDFLVILLGKCEMKLLYGESHTRVRTDLCPTQELSTYLLLFVI